MGHYDSLIRKMGQVFTERRKVMEAALADHGLGIAGQGEFGGSSIWMRAPEHVDTERLDFMLREREVLIEPGHPFFGNINPAKNYYRLAYSSISAARIPEGISRLAAVLKEYR
jgi:GntR family transcriptional regulator/MocR family aminotransferase